MTNIINNSNLKSDSITKEMSEVDILDVSQCYTQKKA